MIHSLLCREMITKSKIIDVLLYASLLIFIVFAVFILCINQDVLYTAHERSEFLIGAHFFYDLMAKPFGLFQYIGGWLSQFLYNPVVGSCMLLGIWGLIYIVGGKAFKLKGSATAVMLLPIAFLLTSLVDLGYWIYDFTVRGYWFSQSVAYLVMLLLLWVARCTPRRWHLVWYVIGLGLYPFFGWFAMLFVICLILTEKPTWSEIIGIVLLVFTAIIWRALLYSDVKMEEVVMAGLPRFVTPSDQNDILSIPFWLVGVVSILIVLAGKYLANKFVPVVCAIAGIIFTISFMYRDNNYTAEMRMMRSAEADKWGEVLDIFTESQKPTISMVMLKNLALMNEGGILDRSFKMGNDINGIYNPDSVHVSFLEIASPVTYYNYGMFNEGFRLNFECGEQTGFSPIYLKMLSRCAFANGELEVVDRFVKLLHGHPYYRDWQPAPVAENVKELHNSYKDELTGVENSDSYVINSISCWYDSDSKVASEQALFFSMLRCDSRRFWASLKHYINLHQGEEFPVHAQEAYIMYYDKSPEEKKMRLPVSQDIYDNYNKFWATLESLIKSGMSQKEIPDKMRDEFGGTYWYYNIFAKKIAR